MARYDTYGQADDRVVEDLDQGFSGLTISLDPTSFLLGFLSVSENGRMDLNGEWQPSKGMEIFFCSFLCCCFFLPFKLYDSTNIGGGVASFSRSRFNN